MTGGGFWPGEPPASEEQDPQERPLGETPAWAQPEREPEPQSEPQLPPALPEEPRQTAPDVGSQPEPEAQPEPPAFAEAAPEPATVLEPAAAVEAPIAEVEAPIAEPEPPAAPLLPPTMHLPGELDIPYEVALLEGSPSGADRTVGVVVSRFNGEVSNQLLASALEALAAAGVSPDRITVMPVPGAFELPIGAMALARTRRYSCIVALGCVIRGETAHFEYVASEAASGLQLAGLETGVPIAFGVLTVETLGQARARTEKGADAARAALEMADLFAQLRAQAKRE
jgi:6,7-dimethyl-8-ribityllumazine synthase